MTTLKSLGYSTITPQQYVQWLQGNNAGLPAKPVLVTFDDNIANAAPATQILINKGFRATMTVVSGFADFPDGWNFAWTDLQAMKATGVWDFQLHAGPQGHALLSGQTCNLFYTCRLTGETPAAYQTRVINDINAGEAAMQSHGLTSGPTVTYAVPWDSWGQDSTDTAVTSFFPSYLASRFPVVFHQDWGYVYGMNRRYRFEIHKDTLLTAFTAALGDTRFNKAGF